MVLIAAGRWVRHQTTSASSSRTSNFDGSRRKPKTPADNASAGLGPEDIGVKASVFVPHSPTYSITGFLGPSGLAPDGANSTGLTTNAIFSANDDLSILKGNHQFAIGGQ